MKLDSICVQGGYEPKNGEPRVIPIIQSTTYKYDSSEEMGDLFDLKKSGYFYSRLQNPTCDYAAQKIVSAIIARKHVAYIDWKWHIVVALWRLIPRCIWRRLSIKIES